MAPRLLPLSRSAVQRPLGSPYFYSSFPASRPTSPIPSNLLSWPPQRTVDAKQLKPMVRTQYQRTAFQIPFDPTVRIR